LRTFLAKMVVSHIVKFLFDFRCLDGMTFYLNFLLSEHCLTMNDILRTTHPNGPYTYLYLCLALIISTVGFLFLTWLVTSGSPRIYSTLVRTIQFFSRKTTEILNLEHEIEEPVDERQRPLVKTTNLCKLIELLQHPLKNQITVLLGPKDAGKTTIMSKLTDTIPPPTAEIPVDGEASDQLHRNHIGFCPQNNSFIPYLNCMGHLLFFGQMRGLSVVKARQQAINLLNEVDLTDKVNMPVQSLSIGMQRRLSLACAMIGGTKLLALDEPSSGLDFDEIRKLWNLLLRLKQTRAILITTHDAEEAELLSGKIAIMDSGDVIAYGSSFFLKREYGNGYTLKLVKSEKNKFNNESVLKLIQKAIPNATMKDSSGSFMSVVLPYENQKDYVRLLKRLEAQKHELSIESIGITDASLEEVCFK
jgi:ABC-type multidrug transport system ATPase subunit